MLLDIHCNMQGGDPSDVGIGYIAEANEGVTTDGKSDSELGQRRWEAPSDRDFDLVLCSSTSTLLLCCSDSRLVQ